ncbi:MAG TPA: DUF1572 family protein [Pyrinomonadaceae bacterium]|nr:DUF1572 family protein [Pyrinomonadaceae bacterium]
MNNDVAKHYLEDAIASYRAYKKLADKALAQLTADEFFVTLDQESNSVAVIMKHIAGNMFSRWTDFLTTDGEKPDRNRDMEFVIEPQTTKADVMDYWERGWQRTLETLESLKPEDLMRTVTIRGEAHTVVQALNRQLAHYPYHIGQIVFLAKHFRSSEWRSLSIPKNKSAEFNKYLEKKEAAAAASTEHRFDTAAFTEDSKKNV